mmetsp:Transcript_13773/g.57905  ORF Transcript_13773/g.57905 Transcript_13773/m.57905 type:complete len:216 (-) Transcript_13773:348-995(-)
MKSSRAVASSRSARSRRRKTPPRACRLCERTFRTERMTPEPSRRDVSTRRTSSASAATRVRRRWISRCCRGNRTRCCIGTSRAWRSATTSRVWRHLDWRRAASRCGRARSPRRRRTYARAVGRFCRGNRTPRGFCWRWRSASPTRRTCVTNTASRSTFCGTRTVRSTTRTTTRSTPRATARRPARGSRASCCTSRTSRRGARRTSRWRARTDWSG